MSLRGLALRKRGKIRVDYENILPHLWASVKQNMRCCGIGKDRMWIFGVILIQRVMERMIKKKQLFGVTEGDVKL